jgi:5'-AMP-activated protein kinase catalytic alpha subunit
VVDHANGGDLFSLIAPGAVGPSMAVAHRWMLQLSQALIHIHSQGIVHRDIKPENILLHDGAIRVCDFGLSCLAGTTWAVKAPGTRPYMPPEVFRGGHVVSPSQDVWSLGIVLYGILFADLPWESATENSHEYMDYLVSGSLRCAHQLSAQMAALLHSMLHVSPSHRATMQDVLAFFSSPRPWLAQHERVTQSMAGRTSTIPSAIPSPAMPAPVPTAAQAVCC